VLFQSAAEFLELLFKRNAVILGIGCSHIAAEA
jgi:hypothetical protein